MTTLRVVDMPPGSLSPNPWNSNVLSPEAEIKLENSIKKFGIYRPITCRELADGTLQILGGEHTAQAAVRLGIELVPVANLGRVPDKKAKALGLADNGRYGEEDVLRLSEILKDLAGEDLASFLPMTDEDVASMFAISNIGLDDLDLPADDERSEDLPDLSRGAPETHTLMRFKVPLESAAAIKRVIDHFMKRSGYDRDKDALAGAGMALADLCTQMEAGK
jgi:ParB-like chromosome segregation protein Spo0J